MPNGPDSPPHGSKLPNIGDPPASLPDARGAALRAAPPASGPVAWGSPNFADSEPRRRPCG
eukprot:5312335-Alexandrium_andersonii.AAC.1